MLANSITSIVLTADTNATGYNFSLLLPGSLSGYVYYDENQNGVMDAPDYGIAHVTVTLEGTNDLGQSVQIVTVTNDDGFYSFSGLRSGTYEIIRTHPAIFIDYKNNVGSLGGTATEKSITASRFPSAARGELRLRRIQSKTCNLKNLAISVGNLFYHSSGRTNETRRRSPRLIRSSSRTWRPRRCPLASPRSPRPRCVVLGA